MNDNTFKNIKGPTPLKNLDVNKYINYLKILLKFLVKIIYFSIKQILLII